MSQKVEIIEPLNHRGWEERVLSSVNYSFFHSSNWARVLYETYGYKPLYFAMIDAGRIVALIPCMEIKSFLTGKRAVSLPFTDHCEPIIIGQESSEVFHSLLDKLIAYGKKAAWKSIELRCDVALPQQFLPSYTYQGHTVDVSRNEDETFSAFRESTKRNIRKAIKEGVKVEILHSLDSIREFYRLNCLTRKDHGLPPQPFRFFEKIYEHVLSKDRGFVALSSYENTYIAGAIYFHLGEKAIYKYGASDGNYRRLRANNLVMWEAIRWCSRNGYKSLCFGRTEPENEGLLQFKRGWGAKERTIYYYKYDVKREAFVSGTSKLSDEGKRIFYNMPIPLLKITGSILYKHIG